MTRVGIREFRARYARYLRRVRGGETLTLTSRGKACAKLSPPNDDADPPFEPIAFGIWKDRQDMRDPARWVRQLREGRLRRHR